MTGLQLVALVLAVVWIGGYVTGRVRPWDRLVDWTGDQLTQLTEPGQRTARSPRFWIAVPIAWLAVAVLWVTHPRRTRANYRADKEAERRHREPLQIPEYDPGWADRRGGTPRA